VHLLLTDRLTCPRCGPTFGLILRADELEERRIESGVLGCPNCREAYPIDQGVGDLRPAPRTELPDTSVPAQPDAGEVETAQALLGLGGELGLTPGVAQTVLTEAVGHLARGLSERLDDLEVVVVGADARPHPGPSWSRLVTDGTLPFHEATVRGVLIAGAEMERWVASAARVVAPRSRVVVLDPPPDAAARLEQAGLALRLDATEAVVAERSPGARTLSPGVAPLSGPR